MTMPDKHQQDKLHFQIERIAFFSDAVIAIALTLLIIEIRAPKIPQGATMDEQIHQLSELIPEFVAFMISFSIIVSQWIKHHRMFGNLINYDKKLILLNSAFLFVIALTPFSTSYFALNNIGEVYLPYIVYGLGLFFLTFLNYLLFHHITHHKKELYDKSETEVHLKLQKAEYLLFPMVLLATLISGYFDVRLALVIYVVSLQTGHFYIKKQKKKAGITN